MEIRKLVYDCGLFLFLLGVHKNFAKLGDFNLNVDQTTGKLLPITDITANPDFGRLTNSLPQEGIDSRRSGRGAGWHPARRLYTAAAGQDTSVNATPDN